MLKFIKNWFQSKWGCRKVEILLQRGYQWKIWLVQIKIHWIFCPEGVRRGPENLQAPTFLVFSRNLLSKITSVKSKLKFCLKHPTLGTDIGNWEVLKPLKSAIFWTGIIQILILATQFGFEKNRNYRGILSVSNSDSKYRVSEVKNSKFVLESKDENSKILSF